MSCLNRCVCTRSVCVHVVVCCAVFGCTYALYYGEECGERLCGCVDGGLRKLEMCRNGRDLWEYGKS